MSAGATVNSQALVVPDPRRSPVPVGWAVEVAAPLILESEDWNFLDEAEARLRAMASYVESFAGDRIEFEKALRIVEKRRGDLLGEAKPGQRTDLEPLTRMEEVDESVATQHRWRTIARKWDDLWPIVLSATRLSEVTQAALLRATLNGNGSEPKPLPTGTYSALVADPPWQYDNKATRGAAEDHYPTMTVAELCALPIAERAAPDSHLYLWVTNGFLREGFEVMEAWGFTYKTCLTWVKPQIGLGNYFRSATEHVLFGVRGKLRTLVLDERNWFEAKRGQHSRKPDSFYDLVERASPGPYLELFARRKRLGWDSWGNEA